MVMKNISNDTQNKCRILERDMVAQSFLIKSTRRSSRKRRRRNGRSSNKAVAAVPPCGIGSVGNTGEKVVRKLEHSGV